MALLSRAQKWQCDGVFKVTPLIASQLYTIHVGYMHDYVPLIYNPCWVYERLCTPHIQSMLGI